jgi:glycosyltransferase involved in cell wall biosynthesis
LIARPFRGNIRFMNTRKPKIAILHRYGLAGDICCGGHNRPRTIEILHERGYEVHFVGLKSMDALSEYAAKYVIMHELPFTWDRANPTHKWSRTAVWLLWLPWVALWCRFKRMDAITHINDTMPLTGWILRIFYGKNVVMTVMDFFCRIYTEKHPVLRPLGNFIEWLDIQSWRRIPYILTKVYFIHDYLVARGVPADALLVERNPIDPTIFFPLEGDARETAREDLGFADDDFVITHHGVMHPNKGNDWVVRRVAELKDEIPTIRFLLMGDGGEMVNLKALVEELSVQEHVLLPGWMPDEESLNAAIASADVGLMMRIGQETDHFHMTDTLNHELACAKPIMSANLRGVAEVITDGQNGFLFEPDDPDEFKSKLLQIYRDPDLRKRFGTAALATSREVSDLEVCAHQVADPIIALVEKKK